MRPERHGETADAAALRARLRHVYWIGGGSGAGKSTIARRMAAEHGPRLYATGDVMSDHASRSTPEDSPFLSEFKAMDMDERWVNRSPETVGPRLTAGARPGPSPGKPTIRRGPSATCSSRGR